MTNLTRPVVPQGGRATRENASDPSEFVHPPGVGYPAGAQESQRSMGVDLQVRSCQRAVGGREYRVATRSGREEMLFFGDLQPASRLRTLD